MSERIDESRSRAMKAPDKWKGWTSGGLMAIAAAIVYHADVIRDSDPVVRSSDPVSSVGPLTSEEQIRRTKR